MNVRLLLFQILSHSLSSGAELPVIHIQLPYKVRSTCSADRTLNWTALHFSAAPQAPILDIHSSGVSTAGQAYTLTCTATVIENLVVEPALEWLARDRNVVGGNDITVRPSVTMGTNTTLTLIFNPLRTSHGGRYTCRASINIPAISFSNSSEADSDVIVQSKSPETINMCEAQTTCCPSFKLCSQILLLVWFMGELVVLDAYTITHPNCLCAYNVILCYVYLTLYFHLDQRSTIKSHYQ